MIQENFPLPIGFSEKDVNVNAPRLFSDEFYLHYLRYTGKAGISIYSVAVPMMIREDVKDIFTDGLDRTAELIHDVNRVLLEKGFIMKPPVIPTPKKVDFVKKQNYLSGFFGDTRPLHGLEIGHLYANIDNDATSKALLIGFGQVAKSDKIRQLFIRGQEMTNKHIQRCSKHLHDGNLPSPSLLDHLVTTTKTSPFSDKLMLYHKVDMFSMKIRAYANGASLNGRRDIGAMYARMLTNAALFVEDATNIMIDKGWLEEPPHAADRNDLTEQ